ncbi:MAG TPA: SprT-like domain-containing protein [Phycisphaerae bacterium]|nr:SprT-like domain-containing protein [Phycisphaerae bacterium]
MDANYKTQHGISLDDIWNPSQPLPTRSALRRMVEVICEIWDAGELSRQIRTGYNMRLSTTLGRALYSELRIELNPRLLAENPGELVPTLAHELAHLVARERYGNISPHGPEFRAMMRSLNLSGRATHNLPVAHLRKNRRTKYLYLHRCEQCGYKFVARSPRRNYYCLACGPEMKWDIYRLPNTPAGKTLLEHLMRNI